MAKEMLKDKDYDLISVIYNASQAAEICRQYMDDARKENDGEAEKFFQEVLNRNVEMVSRGKDLLKNRLH
jgi:hypothetical protein